MATATVALPSPPTTEVVPTTPEKPITRAIFSRQNTWTPAEEEDAEESIKAQQEEEIEEGVQLEVPSPRVEGDNKMATEDTKEETVDEKPEPPSIITSTPRNGAMTVTKSASSGKATPVVPPLPAREGNKKKPQKSQNGFWQRVLCCLNKDLKAVAESTDAETTTAWTLDQEGPKRPIRCLLPDRSPEDSAKKCLVLDLDETLVHSSFKATPNPDYIIPVEIDGHVYSVFVQKRPGVDLFLLEMSKIYELVIYTASLSKYADPLLDLLDPQKTIRYRLFRESCTQFRGSYVKDMSMINRPLDQSIIVDNSSLSFQFHPENAIHCTSFFDDLDDRELDVIGAFLTQLKDVADVRDHLSSWQQFLNQWEESSP